MKVLAVGDTHVKPEIIRKVGLVIDDYDRVVFLGDFFDSWGMGVTENLLHFREFMALRYKYPDKVASVLGNHDLSYMLVPGREQSGFSPVLHMLIHSPENEDILQELRGFRSFIRVNGVTYSHAGFIEGREIEEPTRKSDLWTHDSHLWVRPTDGYAYRPNQVFGHTPTDTCREVQPSVWCIDTFSTYRDGQPIGDGTALEVINGVEFNVVKL